MRTIWFALFDTTLEDVDERLLSSGLGGPCIGKGYRWYYPEANEPVLHIDVSGYEWVKKYDLEEEYQDLLVAVGGRKPTIHVSVHVTGRVGGDEEVRLFADTLLSAFSGVAFDDYLSYSHAWTLEEIRTNARVQELLFFDHKGYLKKQKKQDGES